MKSWKSCIVLLLCNLLLPTQQAYFSRKPPPGVIKAKIGQNITFDWLIHLDATESLILIKLIYSRTEQFESSVENIALVEKDSSVSFSASFERRVSVEVTGALTLHNVSAAQRGYYKCEVSFKDRRHQLHTIADKAELLVGTPPIIYSSPASYITLLEHDHVDMSCQASGNPVPKVLWYRQTQQGWEQKSKDSLRIKNANINDTGLYRCRAENSMDSVERNISVTVYERPFVTSFFHTAALDDTIYECDAITFTCEVSVYPPVKSIYIYHESRLFHRSINTGKSTLSRASNTLLPGGRRGRLKIARISKSDEGKYFCVAENDHGLGYNKTINLKVYDAPRNCERKIALQELTSTATQLNTSMHPTVSDRSVPSNKKRPAWEPRSDSQITESNLLLLGIWFCHSLVCNVFL